MWPAAGFVDTQLGLFMKAEVVYGKGKFSREFKVEAVHLVGERGVSVAQASRDFDVYSIP